MAGHHERRLALFLGTFVVILICNGLWAIQALRTLNDSEDWYAHTNAVLVEVESARAAIAESAAGVRGYLLTGRPQYLAAYNAAANGFRDDLEQMQKLTVDNLAQQRRIARLNQAVGGRFALTAEAIEARRAQGLDAALKIFDSARGDSAVTEIRALLGAIEHQEQSLLVTRLAAARRGRIVAGVALALASVLAVVFLGAIWLIFRRANRERGGYERELLNQQEWLSTTLASIGDGVLATDTSGRVKFVNPVTEGLTGWTSAEAAGRPITEVFQIINEYNRSEVENPVVRALREGIVVGLANHTLLLSRDGRETPIDDSAAPIRSEDGRTLGVVLVFRDVTERKQVEMERERLLERERQSRYAAESADRAKDSFLAIVSHELRTPLGVILGWAGILRNGKADAATVARAAEIVERNARAQAKLVDDMLDISRIVSGKFEMDLVDTEPSTVVSAAVEALRPAAEAKGVTITLTLDAGAGTITADPDRLQQVVWNLLANAIKFTAERGRVGVSLRRLDDHVRIEVQDDGIGISADRLPHVFERFWQGDTSQTRRHGGLGLGLAIVRHLVELHGGTVKAASPGEGYGATFTVDMPAHSPQHSAAATAARMAAGAGRGGASEAPLFQRQVLRGSRIVVVDDEPDGADWVAELLRAAGAEVRTANSAAAGLDAVRTWRPDLLIADIGMPGEDGYSLMKRLRALSPAEGGQTTALALTAHARPEDRIRVLSVGYQMHAAKPIDPVELLIITSSLLNRNL